MHIFLKITNLYNILKYNILMKTTSFQNNFKSEKNGIIVSDLQISFMVWLNRGSYLPPWSV